MRNAYCSRFAQVAAQTDCYPSMFLTDEEARELNIALLVNSPFAGTHEMRRVATFSFPEQPTFVPGFNFSIADWNLEFMYPYWATTNSKRFQKSQPKPCRDWAFDDNDEAFEDYDYADDIEYFARDDGDMARALTTKGPDDEQGDEEGTPTSAN